MAARPLQPSEYEIQREVEALKDIRRRSVNPAALIIDPDLPNQSSSTSPTSPYRQFGLSSEGTAIEGLGPDSSAIDHSGASGTHNVNDPPNGSSDDPFHLFWVPAGLHPEIAPAEFREFLKEHARSSPSDDGVGLGRSASFSSSSSLGRKKSMLSRQYKPMDTEGYEDEKIVPLQRNRSLYYREGPQLTIRDLQKLEELAEEASQSDDPSKLRSVLRRSLSLNVSPTAILLDDMEMDDEADVPIVVPPREMALKRTARTKIRKPGLPGDGGGHRFAASRRGKKAPQPQAEPRTSSDLSTSDHGELESTPGTSRPLSEGEGPDDDELKFTTPSPQPQESFAMSIDSPPIATIDVIAPQPELEPPAPVLHQPQPQRLSVPLPMEQGRPNRTPSPSEHVNRPAVIFPIPASHISPPPASKKDPKDKKGLFKWGDKSNKKVHKDKDRPSEKEPGFLSSIFGKKSKDSDYHSSLAGGASGREAAQALLGVSKSSKSQIPLPSPGLAPGMAGNAYARYPIHVERAIYRLSHIKLANPRRPLYEQVLISNLMFWYLGIINKSQNPSPTSAQEGANGTATGNGSSVETNETEKQEQERLQQERMEKEGLERERLEKERLEKERYEIEMKKKESARRGSLIKAPPGALPVGGRRAEIPVKGPQYEMQHRVMEQEYGSFGGPRSPTSSTSPVLINGGPLGRRPPGIPGQPAPGQPMHSGPVMPVRGPGRPGGLVPPGQPNPPQLTEQYQYAPETYIPPQRPGLPPGAMPPMDKAWMSQPIPPPPPPPPPQFRAPPPNPQVRPDLSPIPNQFPQQFSQQQFSQTSQENLGSRNPGFGKGPMRSLSATASMVQQPLQPNGDLNRSMSHNVVYPKRPRTADGMVGEEEDVPLAVWQQQRRR